MNRTLQTLLAVALVTGAGAALAEDSWSTLNTYASVTVNAPPARAWAESAVGMPSRAGAPPSRRPRS